jgi:predicted 3-demethylubiquinone-9 3-methyltransferase (glyoxalase superfamily)
MPTITPFLWFDTQAEEAMNLYTSIFKNSKVIAVNRAGGRVMTVEFELEGQRFFGLNAGPHHKFTEAVSFFISVDTQAEIDEIWEKLLADGGRPDQCGWLKDKFGLSWQVVPKVLTSLLFSPEPAKAKRSMDAMMSMVKFDIAALQKAHDGV